jgi:hypothetical protein
MKTFTAHTIQEVHMPDKDWVELVTKELKRLTDADFIKDGLAYSTEDFRGRSDDILLGPASDLDRAIFMVIEKLNEKYKLARPKAAPN